MYDQHPSLTTNHTGLTSMGGLCMISGAFFSKPRPISGGPDVTFQLISEMCLFNIKAHTIMIQMICTGANGNTESPLLSLNDRPISSVNACAMFSARTCRMNFWILSNIRRPSSTALRMDAKLSSYASQMNAFHKMFARSTYSQDDVGRIFSNIRPIHSHRNTNISVFQGG